MLESPARPPALGPEGLPNFPRARLELETMRLVEARAAGRAPTIIVAPFALHDAAIADLATGHSLARALLDAGVAPLALVSWRPASYEMRDFGIDAYLADLNVAVDDFGGRVSLVGLCQGGWLAALYAARFPGKVARLVVAGAPLDPGAGESAITRALALTPPALIEGLVGLAGGRVFQAPLSIGGGEMEAEFVAQTALQCDPDCALRKVYEAWRGRNLILPGRYFLETTQWLFRDNRLARGRFPALGRLVGLGEVAAPTFALAARDDAVVAPAQAIAIPGENAVVEGGHLSLFMGRRTLERHWPRVARWLTGTPLRRAAGAR